MSARQMAKSDMLHAGFNTAADEWAQQAGLLDESGDPVLASGTAGMSKAANRTALAGMATTYPVYLTEAGREGVFVFEEGDFSVKVEVDTVQGIYVPPSSDTTGESGCWVRKYDTHLNVTWFGAVGDEDTDCLEAFDVAARVTLSGQAGDWNRTGTKVYVPMGIYKFSDTWEIKAGAVHFYGEVGQGNTQQPMLVFPAGYCGVIIHTLDTIHDTTDLTYQTPGQALGSANGSILEGLTIKGGGHSYHISAEDLPTTVVKYGGHGVWMRGVARLKNLNIRCFAGNGFHTLANGGGTGNINNFMLESIWSMNHHGDSFHIQGGDGNVGLMLNCQSEDCDGWAVNDLSFLGLTVIGHQDNGCRGGSYYSDGQNAPSVFLGCYTEWGAHDQFYGGARTAFIGGLLGTERSDSGALRINGNLVNGFVSNQTSMGGRALFGPRNSSPDQLWGFGDENLGGHIVYDDEHTYAMRYMNLGTATEMQFYKDSYTLANNQRRDYKAMLYGNQMAPWFPGFYVGTLHTYVTYRDAAPSAAYGGGTWHQGDKIYDMYPVTGGYEGWVCTAPGTTDTLGAGVTATTTSGSATFTVNNLGSPQLREGQFIDIAGVSGAVQIKTISGTTIVAMAVLGATVSGAAVSFHLPTFKTFGPIGANYTFSFFAEATPTASEVLGRHIAASAFTIPANFASALLSDIETNPTASFVIDVKHKPAGGAFTTIGTITVSTGGAVTAVTTSGTSKAIGAGDVLKFIAPSSADATAAGMTFTVVGVK